MTRSLAVSLVLATHLPSAALAVPPPEFGSWPAGRSPREIGAKIVAQFESCDPERYQPAGVTCGDRYARGKYVTYPVVSLWVNAMRYADAIDDTNLLSRLAAKLDPFYAGGGKADKVSKPRHVDFSVFGAVGLEVSALTGDERGRGLGLRYADDQWDVPRRGDTDCFPDWLKSHYVPPEKQLAYLRNGYSGQTRLWIDDMYMINLLQTCAYRATSDEKYIRRAAKEMCLYLDRLQLGDGLFNHSEGVPFRWGRGNGWMAAGMPMLLKYLRDDDAHYARILGGYRKMMDTLLAHQRSDGLWGQLVDDPGSWAETSGSAMFTSAFIEGIRNGWIESGRFAPAARKAYLALCERLDERGNLADVCTGTSATNDRAYYYDRPRHTGDPHGQAALLWCVNALLSFDIEDERLEYPPKGFRLRGFHQAYPPLRLKPRRRLIGAVPEGVLRVTPTFESCSLVFGARKPIEGLRTEIRREGGEWMQAEPPVWFEDSLNYRCSALRLEEDTSYSARVTASGRTLAAADFRTWKSRVPVARTVEIDPATAKYPIVISDRGAPDGWIRYTAKKGSVVGGKDVLSGIFVVDGAQYVLLDEMEILGGGSCVEERHPPILIKNSRGVRVRNCDIHGWGEVGEMLFTAKAGGQFARPGKDGKPRVIVWSPAIMVFTGAQETVIERCYFHDPRGRSISWYYSHPSTVQAIVMAYPEHSTVIRWNDFVGSDLHRYDDCIGGFGNFKDNGGFNRDADVSGNFAIYANDDCFELDGGQQNVRCFGNRTEQAVSDISIQGSMASPCYVYDNLLGSGGEEQGLVNPRIKTSSFEPMWYGSHAAIFGNWIGESRGQGARLPATARLEIRDDNVFSTGEVPRSWATEYPKRPLPFVLDTGSIRGVRVTGDEAAPSRVTVVATSAVRQPFAIRKNHDADWFTVEPSSGVLEPGETTLTVSFDPERTKGRRFWRSAFLVRTPEGLSRCVSVEVERMDFEPPVRPVVEGRKTMYADLPEPVLLNRLTPEFAFDVKEEGDYWFFLRVKGENDEHVVPYAVSLDGSKAEPSRAYVWPTHAVWNMVFFGRTTSVGIRHQVVPRHLVPGRHTLRVSSDVPLRVLGAALSCEALPFEPR